MNDEVYSLGIVQLCVSLVPLYARPMTGKCSCCPHYDELTHTLYEHRNGTKFSEYDTTKTGWVCGHCAAAIKQLGLKDVAATRELSLRFRTEQQMQEMAR